MKTNTQRQAEHKAKMRANGYVHRSYWVKAGAETYVKEFIGKANKTALKGAGQ